MNIETLTYRRVKQYLADLADLVPDVDVQCEDFAVSYAPESTRKEKEDVYHPESIILTFRIKNKKVYLKVETDNRKKV